MTGNKVQGTAQRGIYLRSTTESQVTENDVAAAGGRAPAPYDAIELAFSANDNLVAENTCRLGPGTRMAVGIGPGCRGNCVLGNVVVPWTALGPDVRPLDRGRFAERRR